MCIGGVNQKEAKLHQDGMLWRSSLEYVILVVHVGETGGINPFQAVVTGVVPFWFLILITNSKVVCRHTKIETKSLGT